MLGKVPFIGPIAANKLNSLYAEGGTVAGGASTVPAGMKGQAINTPAQLIALVKKMPDIAAKSGLTPELIKAEVAKAAEVPMKKRGGKMKKKMGGDTAMVHSGGGGEGVGSFARGGKVLSVF